MRAPATQTPEAFCELVYSDWPRHITTQVDLAKVAHVSLSTLSKIKKKSIPDFRISPARQVDAWISTVTQLCAALDLDTLACLKACGLPATEKNIRRGNRKAAQTEISTLMDTPLSKEDLNALIALTKILGEKPLLLSFALEFLRQKNAQ